jgi:proteasome lid subunit RPN8/RPN11
MTIQLPRSLADALVAHAREGRPNEVCGVAGVEGSRVVRLERARNAASTPQVRFTFGDDGYRLVMRIEREGLDVGIYHSHPASPAYPSATDRAEMSATWPDCLQLMVSLRHDGTTGPEVNAYRIDREGNVAVEDLQIVDG